VLVGCVWKPFFEQAAGGEWDMMDLIGKAGEQAAIQLGMNTWLSKSSDEKFLS
jgi:hypothetical protein